MVKEAVESNSESQQALKDTNESNTPTSTTSILPVCFAFLYYLKVPPLFIGGPVDDDNHPTCSYSSTTELLPSSETMNEAAAANNEMKALPSPEPSYQITSMYTNS